jgi:hypothetical protein
MADGNRRATAKAAEYLLGVIRRLAPTEKSAASFRTRQVTSGDVYIYSEDDGTIATERGSRHPLFATGPRDSGGGWDHWYGPAGRQRGRKHFMEKGADAAAERAADEFADEWARIFVTDSPWEARG